MSSRSRITAELNLMPGSVIDGRYELLSLLGEGGFAAVFEAEDRTLGRTVAIKVLDVSSFPDDAGIREKILDRFEREAKMAGRVEHPGVVAIHDVGYIGEHERHPYIVMERLEGHDLEEQIFQIGPLPPARALPLVIGALEALGEAHEMGIVHKDLKPGNIFLVHAGESDESLRIVDFGVAFMENAAEGRLTKAGEIPGTPNYLTPEYINDQIVTPALDVYQVALILVEMLSGERMVTGTTVMRCLLTHISGELEVPRALVESELGPILKVALEKDHERRFANGGAFANALRTIDPADMPDLRGQEQEVVLLATQSPSPTQDSDPDAAASPDVDSGQTLFGLGEKEEFDTDRFLNEARQTGRLSSSQTNRLFVLESAYIVDSPDEDSPDESDSRPHESPSAEPGEPRAAVDTELSAESGPSGGIEARAPSMWEFTGDAYVAEDEPEEFSEEPEPEFEVPGSSRRTVVAVVVGLLLVLAVGGAVALVAWGTNSADSEGTAEAVEATEESTQDPATAEHDDETEDDEERDRLSARSRGAEAGEGVIEGAGAVVERVQARERELAKGPSDESEPESSDSRDAERTPTPSKPKPSAEPASNTQPSKPDENKSLWVEVRSTPPKAFVTTEGKLVGLTPCKVMFDPGEESQPIKFDKDGYEPVHIQLRRDDYPSRSVELSASSGENPGD